jgi:hypothetical protein
MTTDFNLEDGLEPFGKGFALPRRFWIVSHSPKELPYSIEMEIVLEESRFICRHLGVSRFDVQTDEEEQGPPVTSEGIRQVPMQELIRAHAPRLLHRVKKVPNTSNDFRATLASDEFKVTPLRRLSFKRFAKSGPTDEALEHVALIYRLAYACNDNPTAAVVEAFGLPRSTAERWVSKARDLGFIDIPDPRRRK